MPCSLFFFSDGWGWGGYISQENQFGKCMMDHQVESQVHVLVHATRLNATISGIVGISGIILIFLTIYHYFSL